jgi:sec-independent protein translocase protein TatA
MGTQETIFILIAILLMFGGKKLPELARGLGKGIREFKDASEGVKEEIHKQMDEVQKTEPVTPPVKSEPVIIAEPLIEKK